MDVRNFVDISTISVCHFSIVTGFYTDVLTTGQLLDKVLQSQSLGLLDESS